MARPLPLRRAIRCGSACAEDRVESPSSPSAYRVRAPAEPLSAVAGAGADGGSVSVGPVGPSPVPVVAQPASLGKSAATVALREPALSSGTAAALPRSGPSFNRATSARARLPGSRKDSVCLSTVGGPDVPYLLPVRAPALFARMARTAEEADRAAVRASGYTPLGVCLAPVDGGCDRHAAERQTLCEAHAQRWSRHRPTDTPIGSNTRGWESVVRPGAVERGRAFVAAEAMRAFGRVPRWLLPSAGDPS